MKEAEETEWKFHISLVVKYAKIDRDRNNKMHLPESKRIVEEKYQAVKLILKAAEDCV